MNAMMEEHKALVAALEAVQAAAEGASFPKLVAAAGELSLAWEQYGHGFDGWPGDGTPFPWKQELNEWINWPLQTPPPEAIVAWCESCIEELETN